MKTPKDFMIDNLGDEQAQEEWDNYLENLIVTVEKKEEDDESGE